MIDRVTADIAIGGLSLWFSGRAYPGATNSWDADWIIVTAIAEAKLARVEVSGPWVRSSEISSFLQGLAEMRQTLKGQADLNCIEPMLGVRLAFFDSVGHIRARVSITPDHLTQSHSFEFELDQTNLDQLIAQCKRVLATYPVTYQTPTQPA